MVPRNARGRSAPTSNIEAQPSEPRIMGDRSFLRCPRGLQRKCLQAMASTTASGRCLILQKAWRSFVGSVRQNPTDRSVMLRLMP
jgi:hypothetical protein